MASCWNERHQGKSLNPVWALHRFRCPPKPHRRERAFLLWADCGNGQSPHEWPAADEDPGLRGLVLQAAATEHECLAARFRAPRQHCPREYPLT